MYSRITPGRLSPGFTVWVKGGGRAGAATVGVAGVGWGAEAAWALERLQEASSEEQSASKPKDNNRRQRVILLRVMEILPEESNSGGKSSNTSMLI